MSYENLEFHKVSWPSEFVLHVEFNRPKVLNAIHRPAYMEYFRILQFADTDPDVRVIVVSGVGRAFCAGLDVLNTVNDFRLHEEQSRQGILFSRHIKEFQDAIAMAWNTTKPVIGVAHGPSIGLAIDILTAFDIRFSSEDATFSVREIEIGMAADIGTLQRLPKICGNQGWVKDICFTGRDFKSDEAQKEGLIQFVHKTKDEAVAAAYKYAENLALKSPVALQGVKKSLNFAIEHNHEDGLRQIREYNVYALGEDFVQGAMNFRSKVKPKYPKL